METIKIILVCGSRDWQDREVIRRTLLEYPQCRQVIHGGCRGADQLADQVAHELKLDCQVYEAIWHKYGKQAGPLRNIRMLKEGQPHLVLAFHDHLEKSKGTKHMVHAAQRQQVRCRVISSSGRPTGSSWSTESAKTFS